MLKVAIIIGSTRPGRRCEAVARWVHEVASRRTDADYELVDIADFNLPMFDEPNPPSSGRYTKPHTFAWAARIAPFDAFVFVTPEYNHATSAALKNAIDFLGPEWRDKVAGFVGYGSAGGTRAVENLRLVMGDIHIADVRNQVALNIFQDWEEHKTFKPLPNHEPTLLTMLDQVVAWGEAFKGMREAKAAARKTA